MLQIASKDRIQKMLIDENAKWLDKRNEENTYSL
jgi:hypothetical protein